MSVIETTAVPVTAGDPRALLPCEIYHGWQEAQEAFVAWCAAAYGKKGDAYVVYRAAADREDIAAERWLAV